jgi:SAM-dependent methyltransferase
VDFYDYRPAALHLSNLKSQHADLTALPFSSSSLTSVSCMHTIEHVGLGRYGDPIDPEGDLKAINELKRVCAVNGSLLIVVPVGIKKIQFNAHRIYDPFDIIEYMSGFELKDFSLIDDHGTFTEKADLKVAATQKYGCGCYWFIKK